jgi:aspartyl-tRNA(Asn)/glutamyl-tRNA(Gln) amidotransferase subunit C
VIDDAITRHVARLARLGLTEDEIVRMQHELRAILEYVDQVQGLDLADIVPTTHAIPLSNVLREDLPTPSVPADLALREGPNVTADGFTVPRMG